MKVLNGCISIILLLSLVMGIYCAGSDKTYDFIAHLESISAVTEEMPTIEELSQIWTERGVSSDGSFGLPIVHLRYWPLGLFGTNGTLGTDSRWIGFDIWYIWDNQDAQPYWAGWEPITNFVEGVSTLSARVVYTFIWVGGYIESFFELVFTLSPTSGIVSKGGNA